METPVKKESAIPNQDEKREVVQKMFDKIAPRYDLVNRILTFGLDTRWRKKTLKLMELKKNSLVLDLACGTGDFSILIEKKGHKSLGIDLSLNMMTNSTKNLNFVQGDLLQLPVKNSSVNAGVCGFALRNLVEIQPFFDEVFRVLKPQGNLAILEVSKPENFFISYGHKIYFKKLVPKIGGLISDKKAYKYLPESTSYLPEKDELIRQLQKSGFVNIEHQQLSGGIAQVFIAHKP